MLFNSPVFLFGYLPLVLLGFFLVPRAARTGFLFFASLAFYTWTERAYVYVLIASVLLNTALALALGRAESDRVRRTWVALAVILNIGALVYFKYFAFIFANLKWVAASVGVQLGRAPKVHLPIAISFITFEALSYVIDVHRRHTEPRRNPIEVGFYVSFFPHLIAGPILRFDDIADAIARPFVTLASFESGVTRFIIGLAKKVLIANTMGRTADALFDAPATSLTTASAWLGLTCYALQIYFDFSGYSDMAIGLGRLFGFELPLNFDLPYSSQSIKEFWRRWHISLSTWFRDYLYIPLGGNRGSALSNYRNLLIVFFLCGLWHGASWTFVVWGLFHGMFLVLERVGLGALVERSPRPVRHAYAMVVVGIGWVFFRAETFGQALAFLGVLVGADAGESTIFARDYLGRELVGTLCVAIPLATLPLADWWRKLRDQLERIHAAPALAYQLATRGAALLVLFASFVALASDTYNPFIYFRF